MVFDQTGSPTNARDLARAILEIIRTDHGERKKPRYDVYHYSNAGICSWYEFAEAIVKPAGSACIIEPVESKQYPTRAVRPRYSGLDKKKIQNDYSLKISHWKDSLEDCITDLLNS